MTLDGVRWCDTAGGDSTRTTDAGEESVTGGVNDGGENFTVG
jgi:hypothetical protein